MKNFLIAIILIISSNLFIPPASASVDLICARFPSLDNATWYDVGCFINLFELKTNVVPGVVWVSNSMPLTGSVSDCGGVKTTHSASTTEYYYDYPEEHQFFPDYHYFELSNHNGAAKAWGGGQAWWEPLSQNMLAHFLQGSTVTLYGSAGQKNHTITPACLD